MAASGNSLPDEPLYSVKLATETVRLTLTPSAQGKTELYVQMADRRVAEIIKMADKGKVRQMEKATERLDGYLVAMAGLNMPGRDEAVETEVATFEAEAPQMMMEEAAPAPAPEPVPEPSPRAQLRRAPEAAEEAPAEEALKAPGPPEGIEPGRDARRGGIESAEPTGLRARLSRRAAENLEALQAVLERVPESARPALRRAIEVADTGYEQALRSLD